MNRSPFQAEHLDVLNALYAPPHDVVVATDGEDSVVNVALYARVDTAVRDYDGVLCVCRYRVPPQDNDGLFDIQVEFPRAKPIVYTGPVGCMTLAEVRAVTAALDASLQATPRRDVGSMLDEIREQIETQLTLMEAGEEDSTATPVNRSGLSEHTAAATHTDGAADIESRDSETIVMTLARFDHMRDKKTYVKTLRQWSQELGVMGRLLTSEGGLIALHVEGERDAVREYFTRLRTHKVDVDSKGNRCLERMMQVLAEVTTPFRVYADFESVEGMTMAALKDHVAKISGATWAAMLDGSSVTGPSMACITTTTGGVLVNVHAKPGASRSQITDADAELGVQIDEPARDGKANAALLDYLTSVFGVKRGAVTLEKGSTSRTKLIKVTGVTLDQARQSVTNALNG